MMIGNNRIQFSLPGFVGHILNECPFVRRPHGLCAGFLSMFLVLGFSAPIVGQRFANNWYFGNKAGLRFDSTVAKLITGEMVTTEATTSISDSAGRTLLYSNGITVWNGNGEVITGGAALKGSITSTQCLLIKHPKDDSTFILFHHEIRGIGSFHYSYYTIIKKKGIADKGKVVLANQPIGGSNATGEKFCATKHQNGRDYWVSIPYNSLPGMVKVDSSGVHLPPITTNSGISITDISESKFSPQGDKVAYASSITTTNVTSLPIQIFKFNNAVGTVTDRITIANPPGYFAYGIEFSCDGKKLYVSFLKGKVTGASGFSLRQYDLSNWNQNAINNSVIEIIIKPSSILGSLQLGPDGKIYSNLFAGSNKIIRINHPNLSGTLCGLDTNFCVRPGADVNIFGLTNFPSSYLISKPSIAIDHQCDSSRVTFKLRNLGNLDSIAWNFGDPFSGNLNISKEVFPTHTYSRPGTYKAIVKIYSCFGIDSLSGNILIGNPPLINSKDTTACNGSTISLPLVQSNQMWSYSVNGSPLTGNFNISSTGSFIISGRFGNCITTDTLNARFYQKPIFELGPDIQRCGNLFPINISGSFPQATAIWSDGVGTASREIHTAGKYKLTLALEGCRHADSIQIRSLEVPEFTLGPDLEFCELESRSIGTEKTGLSYLWNNGAMTNQISVSQNGSYSLRVTNNVGCIYSDSVDVFVKPLPTPFKIGNDTLICFPNTVNLQSPEGYDSFKWENGSSDESRLINTAGVYSCTVFKDGCERSTGIRIEVKYHPVIPPLALADSTFCDGDTITIAFAPQDWEFNWNGIIGGARYSIFEPQEVVLKVENYCGTDEKTASFKKENCSIFIPNLVTQNGNGLNDFFTIPNLWRYGNDIEIFNRWGASVFSAPNYTGNWPPSEIIAGTYYFKLRVQHPKRGANFSGWVEVVK